MFNWRHLASEMDEKGNMGGNPGGRDETADARMGMIQINDLVYRLETDLSVAINRTHKINYFQNVEYNDKQTSIIILNSGSDYVDPRRSFLSFDVVIPVTDLAQIPDALGAPDSAIKDALISCYFGKNGSVLNLIDSVVVSTRSGDELSRVNDFGQLMNMLIPQMFGENWKNSIGQQIGLGSYLGGSNNATPTPARSELRRRRFAIPLYLLSPIFNYGRLLPSMLMSGLRIEIKWKPLGTACQQFWEGCPTYLPSSGLGALSTGYTDSTMTEYKTYVDNRYNTTYGGLMPLFNRTDATWEYKTAAKTLTIFWGTGADPLGYNALDPEPGNATRTIFGPGDYFCYLDQSVTPAFEYRWQIIHVVSATVAFVNANFDADAKGDFLPDDGTHPGPFRVFARERPLFYTREFGAEFNSRRYYTGTTPLDGYTISSPQMSLCSIMLTDAIQRTLNEYSATNGLEIVYADYDRTSTPFAAGVSSVYTEVRKSASRALQVFARIVQSTTNPHEYDSFASCYQSFWNHYQVQLGSLYFPNQSVIEKNSIVEISRDNMLAMIYAYAEDAFDRFHPKAAPTLATLRGHGLDFNFIYLHPTEVTAEHSPSTYLNPPSEFGKWGSAVNGGTTVAATLERSTLFDLSGIPVNNSRVLAIRGEIDTPQAVTLFVYLKYVRLVRVFLVNCEVEQ